MVSNVSSFYNVYIEVHRKLMDLGTTIGLFLCLALLLLVLFCLLLKCFNNRMKKQKQLKDELTMQSEQQQRSSISNFEGAYKEFCQNRDYRRKQSLKESLLEEDILLQKPQIKQVFDISNDLYNLSNLGHKLNADVSMIRTITDRSLAPLHEFKLDRCITNQFEKRIKQDSQQFQFTKRLTKYNREGIFLVQVFPLSICKKQGRIQLGKNVEQQTIVKQDSHFQDMLQTLGYQNYNYGCSKLVCHVDISEIKEQQSYPFKNLQKRQQKIVISEQEYQKLLSQLSDAI